MDRLQTKPALVVAFVCVVVAGCHGPQLSVHAPDIRPREGAQTPLPAYTVNPPDILRIEMEGVPSEEHVIEPGDTVMVNVANTLPEFPIAGPYFVQPNGQVDLGPE